MKKHTKCLVCNSEKLKKPLHYYNKNGLIRCKDCGFVFMEKIPTPKELNSRYEKYSYASQGYLSPLTIESYNLLLDEFEEYRKTNRIMDVGCGRGWFLQEAKKRDWDVFGTEFSKTAIRLCENAGIEMKSGKLDPDSFPLMKFDVITSFEVIEHINNPNEELKNIRKLLRKGGLFYCTTPNFNSLLRYYLKTDYNVIGYPEHLSYYTKKTLNKVARQNGFKPIKFMTTGISITRIKTSKRISNEKSISKESSDEKLRENINKKWYLSVAKNFANRLLTFTGLGMTLKAYYVVK